jgi:hypothetical protein
LIENCVLFPPGDGYNIALNKLKKRYGQPFVVAQLCIDELVKGTVIKPNDVNGLLKFADELNNCQMVLPQNLQMN